MDVVMLSRWQFAATSVFHFFFAPLTLGLSLLALLNPYGLLGGLLFLFFFLVHGTLWLAIRTEGDLQARASALTAKLWPVLLGLAVLFLIVTAMATDLWANYLAHPALFLVVILTIAGLLGIKFFHAQKAFFKPWFASAAAIIGACFFGIIGLYPNVFPSSINEQFSLTIRNASSSPLTLRIMLGVVVIFVPIVLVYQIWAYSLFTGKVKKENLVYYPFFSCDNLTTDSICQPNSKKLTKFLPFYRHTN